MNHSTAYSSTTYRSSTAREERHELLAETRLPYPVLLLTMYRLTYLTAYHLLRALPDDYRSVATASRHLAHLRTLGLATPVDRHINEAKAYHTSKAARDYLRTSQADLQILETRHQTAQSLRLQHELSISDFQADLMGWLHPRSDLELALMERRYFYPDNHMTYAVEDGQPRRLQPDLGFLVYLLADAVKFPFMYFLELDRGTQAMGIIKEKVEQYQSWYERDGKDSLRTLFRTGGLSKPKASYALLFITRGRGGHDFRRMTRMVTHIRRVRPRPPVMLTTFELLDQHRQMGSRDPAIWYPVNDVSLSHKASYDDMERYLREMQPVVLLPKA